MRVKWSDGLGRRRRKVVYLWVWKVYQVSVLASRGPRPVLVGALSARSYDSGSVPTAVTAGLRL